MKVHGGQFHELDGHKHCTYCGSITPQEALRRLTTPGCRFSATDKGGYKMYIDSEKKEFGKFYGAHLEDFSAEELAKWDEVSRRVFGRTWKRDAQGRLYSQVPKVDNFYGFQTWGVIGLDGKPEFHDGSAIPPDEAWWTRTEEKEE